jgi:orotate phosphoribosyltransferase-like protein
MHNTDTHHRFIDLRAQGLSLTCIADELHVSKRTLLAWQRKFREEIADLKSVELEALQDKVLASHAAELSQLADYLKRVESVLATRKLEYVSTEFLFGMAASLRSQIRKTRVVPVFSTSPSGDLPEPPDVKPQNPDPKPEP